MDWFRQWLSHATEPLVMYGTLGLGVGVGYVVWRICRTIVQIGYFCMFTAIGFVLASGGSLALNHSLAPFPVLGGAAISFGFFVSVVRSKVLKAVGAATALIVAHTVGTFWLKNDAETKQKLLPGVEKQAPSKKT